MPNEVLLSSRLRTQPSAPDGEFEKFTVGRVWKYIAELRSIFEEMLACRQPSSIQLILGPNGNGKTLLNNALRRLATDTNESQSTRERKAFTVLFSRISLNQLDPVSMGVELARGLQVSLYKPADITYSAIAAEILRRFTETHKPPLNLRLAAVLPKYALKKVIRKYQDAFEGLITTDEADPISAVLDRAYAEVQKAVSRSEMRREFRRYAESKQLGSFLSQFFDGGRGKSISIRSLNKALYNDLELNQRTSHPLDTLRALASIARDVDCKLLILMIDDCNVQQGQDYLLQIVDSLGEFTRPKLLLLVSAIGAIWSRHLLSDPEDFSKQQKLNLFGNPLTVGPPTEDELTQLLVKLEELVRSEESPRWIELADETRTSILGRCKGKSFREATKIILDELDRATRLTPV